VNWQQQGLCEALSLHLTHTYSTVVHTVVRAAEEFTLVRFSLTAPLGVLKYLSQFSPTVRGSGGGWRRGREESTQSEKVREDLTLFVFINKTKTSEPRAPHIAAQLLIAL
jgi:hypothetical protein